MNDLNLMVKKLFLKIFFVLFTFITNAQDHDSLVYYNADNFQIIGKGFQDTESLYDRLPKHLKNQIRPVLWNLSKNSAGIAIRFCSNTSTIRIRWDNLFVNNMSHMAATGVRGLDLYAYEKGNWQYISTAKPEAKITEKTLISNMPALDREYMLYLPLYDGIQKVEIGIDVESKIFNPKIPVPQTGNPIVFYGTSITQGGCASRPGMAYPSIIARKMNIETINLGFSGNGLMDWEILDEMLRIDACCYVIDCLPNCNLHRVNERGYQFIKRLLTEKNETPVIMVKEVGFAQSIFNLELNEQVTKKNNTWVKIFKRLKNEGHQNLFLLSNENLIGNDFEGTVDGRHFTDLGFKRFSEKMLELIDSSIRLNKF